jgi:phosphohistidine phosphatase SixA
MATMISPRKWHFEMIASSPYIRACQFFFMVLTVCGSVLNSMRLEGKPPLVAAILAMGVLHVGALEVCCCCLLC